MSNSFLPLDELLKLTEISALSIDLTIDSPEGRFTIKDQDRRIIHVILPNRQLLRYFIQLLPGSLLDRGKQLKEYSDLASQLDLGFKLQIEDKIWIDIKPNEENTIRKWNLVWQELLTYLKG